MEFYITQIIYWACNFAPRSWSFCAGQLEAISQNTALFSLLGTNFGGDGRTTFGLPDLRGRIPIGAINGTRGPGLLPYQLGERGGTEFVTLTILEMPQHNHAASTTNPTVAGANATIKVNNASSSQQTPENHYLGLDQAAPIYDTSSNSTMASDAVEISSINFNPITTTIGLTGGSQSHENRQPFLGLNPCICVQGLFPERS